MRLCLSALGKLGLVLLGALALSGGSPGAASKASLGIRGELLTTLKGCRPLSGRLAGQAAYAPFRPSCRVVPSRDLLRRLERKPEESTSTRLAQLLADRGVLELISRKPERGVVLLERAARLRPNDTRIANDLAVAHIALADAGRGAYQLVLALGALSRAGSSLLIVDEVRFNHALVLGRLQLISQALPAWSEYLQIEPSWEWRAEGASRLKELEIEDLGQQWQYAKRDIWKAGIQQDEGRVIQIVKRFLQEARIWGQQEVLAAWARAQLDRDYHAAEDALSVARTIGKAIARENGERSVADAVACIDRSSGAIRDRLARGHLAYAQGVELLENLKIEEASRHLGKAHQAFSGTSSPVILWSRYWLAVSDYYNGNLNKSFKILRNILPLAIPYPALEGRIRWSLGVIGMVYIDFGISLSEHRQALDIFDRLRERENKGAIEYLLAESLQLLGETEEAWKHREEALKHLAYAGPSIRLNNLLLDSSRALVRAGRFQEALYLQEEELNVARRLARPATLVESLLSRGHLLSLLGRTGESAKDFAEAQSRLSAVSGEAIRKRLWAESVVAQSQLALSSRPETVLGPLSEVIAYYESNDLRYNAARAYLLRAQSYLKRGLRDLAERDLMTGIEAHEAAWRRLQGNSHYYTYLDQWQLLFDEAIRWRIEQRRDSEAWELLERAKGAGRLPGGLIAGRPSLSSIQRTLEPGSALIEYAVLPDRLLIWRIWLGGIKLISVPIREQELRKQVDGLLMALQEGPSNDSWRPYSVQLFEALIRPIMVHSPADERWILVPDKFLSSVPFAALLNNQESSFLIETRTFGVSPSAELYARARQRSRGWSAEKGHLLAVASPRWSRTEGGKILPALPEAHEEVVEVSSLYSSKELLIGEEVTRERLLENLGRANVLHFAGHSRANSANPELSRLVLGRGTPELDLLAKDLLARRLDHLDLVVLAACETGVGDSSRGAASGMAWAFQAAGIPAVVSTLWNVDDGISRHLSVYFHRSLRAGVGGAEALRSAQLKLLRGSSESFSHPSAWAAYELMGELTARPKRRLR